MPSCYLLFVKNALSDNGFVMIDIVISVFDKITTLLITNSRVFH